MIYKYVTDLDSEILDEAIKLRTTLRSEYVGLSRNDGEVCIEFSRPLLSSEEDQIIDLVNNIGPTYDLVIRKDIEKNTMAWAMEQGHTLLRQFASNNLYRQKTATQIEALVSNYPNIINSLVTGSLSTALFTFMTMVPDENISQEEIDEFALRLKIILGVQ